MPGFGEAFTYGRMAGRQVELANHYLDFFHHGDDALFICFEPALTPNADLAVSRQAKLPWGHALTRLGFSVLGIKCKATDWFRDPDLHAFFRSGRVAELSRNYRRTCLYGPSMGGFGALAFAEAVPDASVLALSPQATLDPARVPWEMRFPGGTEQDWSGDFNDAGVGARGARDVLIVYDPFTHYDARHIAMIREGMGDRPLRTMKIPCAGHTVANALVAMDAIKTIPQRFVAGTLDDRVTRTIARDRRATFRYYAGLACRTRSRVVADRCREVAAPLAPRPDLNLRLAVQVAAKFGDWPEVIALAAPALEAVEPSPHAALFHVALAHAAVHYGDLDAAIDHVSRALLLVPDRLDYQKLQERLIARREGREEEEQDAETVGPAGFEPAT